MSARRFFLDAGLGETRGVVLLDGRPERLLISRDGDPAPLGLGARCVARVANVKTAAGGAFLAMPGGFEGLLPLRADEKPPAQGAMIEVQVRTEPRAEKAAVVQVLGAAEGPPRLLEAGPGVEAAMAELAAGEPIIRGRSAREAADLAQAQALDVVHPLPGGGDIAVEITRALTSIDVDLGGREGEGKRVSRAANLVAVKEAARVLRLKGLGGLVIFDFVGRGHDGPALLAAAKAAFAPDGGGVALGPLSRFGTLELTLPRRRRPVVEILSDGAGRLSAQTLALMLIRDLERQGLAAPGAKLSARCAPAVGQAVQALIPLLQAKIGGRFTVEPRADYAADRLEVIANP